MKRTYPWLLLALSLFLPSLASAQQRTFTIDPQSSEVAFTLGGNDHTTHGTFHVETGSIDFDPGAQKISGSVAVAAGSGQTGNGSRDHKMTNDVLEASRFAEVTFAPQSFQGSIAPSSDSTIQVTGVFTLRGTPHDLTVPMQVHLEGDACTAKTHFEVPYVKWGLKDPSFLVFRVAKEVGIDITLKGHLSPPR